MSAVLLHLHTGSLTGWFAEALRHSARASGEAPPSDAAVRARVLAWREWIEDGLLRSGHLTERLEWPEEDARPPESVAVPHDALAALRLLLACRERPPAPAELPEHPAAHPAWIALAENDFADSPFDQVLVPECWLPGRFAFTFPCPWPDGHELRTGSVGALRDQLQELVTKVFEATPLDPVRWEAEPPQGRDLLRLAKHATGRLMRAVEAAADRAQPLWLAPDPPPQRA